MKTFDFTQATISHNLKDPHSKALEPGRLSLMLALATQSHRGGGLRWGGRVHHVHPHPLPCGVKSPTQQGKPSPIVRGKEMGF
jgi:hypothetical protein